MTADPENIFTELYDKLESIDFAVKIIIHQNLSKSRPARLKIVVEDEDHKLITIRAQDEKGNPHIYIMANDILRELKRKGIIT